MQISPLSRKRLEQAKCAFTTRRVDGGDMQTLLSGPQVKPAAGDLVLATVDEVGQHQRLELRNGRRAHLFPGDEIVVCYGNRYAPDQFEALVGDGLDGCDLVAAGGIASREVCRHDRMRRPTRILPIGLIGNAKSERLNLADYAIKTDLEATSIPVILVAGTSMNAGKTTTAVSLVRGFKSSGAKVAGIKATGTGAGGDLWHMTDMGADIAIDFTDAGFVSSYKVPDDDILRGTFRLIAHAQESGCDVAVIEIADGLQHRETEAILRNKALTNRSLGILFAANDALGAKAGVELLQAWDHRIFAISGQLTRAPLAMRETLLATGLPVYTAQELQSGILSNVLLKKMKPQHFPEVNQANGFIRHGVDALSNTAAAPAHI